MRLRGGELWLPSPLTTARVLVPKLWNNHRSSHGFTPMIIWNSYLDHPLLRDLQVIYGLIGRSYGYPVITVAY